MQRTYVVTGAASGIGQATAALLRNRGHRVIGVDVRSVDVVADLSTSEGRQEAIDGILCEAGRRLDAVIANAGLALPNAATVAVNYFGAVELLNGLRPALAAARAPRAVVTSSMATLMPVSTELVDACLAGDEALAVRVAGELEASGPQAGGIIYPSSKRALSRWVRREAPTARWAGCGIPLNAVAPGIVETPMVAGLMDDPATREATDAMVPMPLGGHLQASQVAALLAWLTSEENSGVCGQTVYIDGGSEVLLRGDDVWGWNDPVSAAIAAG